MWSQDNSQGCEGCKYITWWLLWGCCRRLWVGKAVGSPGLACDNSCEGHCGAHSPWVSINRPVLWENRCFWIWNTFARIDIWLKSSGIWEVNKPERSIAWLGKLNKHALLFRYSSDKFKSHFSTITKFMILITGEEDSSGKEARVVSWQGSEKQLRSNWAWRNSSSSSIMYPKPSKS